MTRILGIDPGSQRTGVGIIDVDAAGKVTHVHHQPLVLLDAESFPLRLRKLLDGLWALIEEYRPDEVGVEQVFLSNNAMSALKLGQARGAAIAACVARDLPVSEYAAKEIKLGLVGSGGADKKQVQHMLAVMLVQVGLGLFASDLDGLESGPLSHLVSFEASRAAAELHETVFRELFKKTLA